MLHKPLQESESPINLNAPHSNAEFLIGTAELRGCLDEPDVRILDARPLEDYLKGHVKNALHINRKETDDIAANRCGLPMPTAKAETLFGGLGIDRDTRVVIYGNLEVFYGVRIFYVLQFFGHHNVQILNGGIDKWLAEGREQTQQVASVSPRMFMARPKPSLIATAELVTSHLEDPNWIAIDGRTRARYHGRD